MSYIGKKNGNPNTDFLEAGGELENHDLVNVDSSGNLGVGTSSPSAKLDVVGDIEVSGGVYVGGTGSANYLDDFEEGTFDPTYRGYSTTPTVTYDTGREGYYVKVGKMVYCMIHMRTDAISGITTDTLYIGGLPFTVATGNNSNTWTSGGNVWADAFVGEEPELLMARWNTNMCMLGYRTAFGTNPTASSTNDLDTGANKNNLYATITYLTDS